MKDAPPRRAIAAGCVEIGNLDKKPQGPLSNGVANTEVLCSRKSLFGNPFNLDKAKGLGKGKGEKGGGKGKGEKHKNDADPLAEGAVSRDDVCLAFEEFLDTVLLPSTDGCLTDIAENIARRRGLPPTVFGRDWRRDFGPLRCADFRAAFLALRDLVMIESRDGAPGVRLMCHCVPLRCHCESIAGRLTDPPALASGEVVSAAESSRAAASAVAPSCTASALTQPEKSFLKSCKVVRGIWMLEAQQGLAKNQLDKIAKKPEALNEVRALLQVLAADSDLRQKNQDVISAASGAA